MIDVPKIDANGLRVHPAQEDGALVLSFVGSADSRSHAPLEAMFARVHAEAVRLESSEVTIDLRECEFLNSSCFKAFVVWLENIIALDEDDKYRLRFRYEPSKSWQSRTIQSLARFATDLVTLEPSSLSRLPPAR